MIKKILEIAIRKRKNPSFRFDQSLSTSALWELLFEKIFAKFRGFIAVVFLGSSNAAYVGRGVKFQNAKNIMLGESVTIGDFAHLSALGKGHLTVGNGANIGAFSRIIISTSYNFVGEFIDIGDNVGFGEFSYLGGAGGLSIGRNTIIGQYFSAHPENHVFFEGGSLIRNQGVTRSGISIGENCWIGSKVTILDGVKIGDNCVIAAGAVVNSSFPDNVLIGGVPAVLLKNI